MNTIKWYNQDIYTCTCCGVKNSSENLSYATKEINFCKLCFSKFQVSMECLHAKEAFQNRIKVSKIK